MPDAASGNLKFMLRALKYRNYRLFFSGQILSLIGTWLTSVATSWLVYTLGKESMPERAALLLGAVNFASQFPVFLLTPLTGVWIDRYDRHRILIFTQSLAMLQSLALAYLALSGLITIGQIMVLSVLQGLINSLDMPARQTFVVELVESREDLSNAIALNSSMVHTARLIGPALAGLLIYHVGEGWCFLIDGISYLAVLTALLLMRVESKRKGVMSATAWHASFREGLVYALGFMPIRTLLALVAVTSLMAMSQAVLMPIFADQIFGGQERTLGLLLCASGLGAVAGSLYLASRRSVLGLGKVIAWAAAALGLGLMLFSSVTNLYYALPILLVTGCAMVVQMAAANTVLQTIVEEDKRGRVMSLFTMAFIGMTPFGSLLAGGLASLVGAQRTLTITGAFCLVSAAVFALKLPALRPLVRPIYVSKGILPELALGMQSAAAIETNK